MTLNHFKKNWSKDSCCVVFMVCSSVYCNYLSVLNSAIIVLCGNNKKKSIKPKHNIGSLTSSEEGDPSPKKKVIDSMLNLNQLCAHGVQLDNVSRVFLKTSTRLMRFTNHDLVIPLKIEGSLSVFHCRWPTDANLVEYKCITLTSDAEWLPQSTYFAKKEEIMAASAVTKVVDLKTHVTSVGEAENYYHQVSEEGYLRYIEEPTLSTTKHESLFQFFVLECKSPSFP